MELQLEVLLTPILGWCFLCIPLGMFLLISGLAGCAVSHSLSIDVIQAGCSERSFGTPFSVITPPQLIPLNHVDPFGR
jgi:hypothetical protein